MPASFGVRQALITVALKSVWQLCWGGAGVEGRPWVEGSQLKPKLHPALEQSRVRGLIRWWAVPGMSPHGEGLSGG